MAIEPVNERPIFPALIRADSAGVGTWSVSMIRQLTTVFQQYGYKLNKTLLTEDLDTEGGEVVTVGGDSVLRDSDLSANGGTVAEVDEAQTWTATQTFTPVQVFSAAPMATGHPLRFDELAANGGSIPEEDRSNTFSEDQIFAGGPAGAQFKSDGSVDHVYFEFYARDADLNARSGFIGYSSAGTTDLRIANQLGVIRIDDVGGIIVGGASGGAQGDGTLNAQAVYDDGVLLTDYVFDAEIDGVIDTDAYDRAVPDREFRNDKGEVIRTEKRFHAPARKFSENKNETDPKVFEQRWRQSRKLPAIGRLSEKASVGELTQALLETCEVQAVHIAKLEARLDALENPNGGSNSRA